MSRRKKIIITTLVIVLIAALAVFLYFFFNRAPVAPPNGGEFPPPGEDVTPPEEPPTQIPEDISGPFEPILRQLSKVPIAGAILGAKDSVAIARYQERATGNIYEITAAGEDEKRLTNTTIPKVSEALWSKTGSALVSRYVRDGTETIESFSGLVNVGSGGSEGELAGIFLPRGIADAAISPAGNTLFYLQEENGGVNGIQSDLSGNGKTSLWTSPVKEWLVSWPSQSAITVLSKPSALANGMMLSLDPVSGKIALLLRGIPGLTALASPSLSQILYSQSTESGLLLRLFSATGGRQKEISFTTLPEKCAWAKSGLRVYCGVPKTIQQGNYPDIWYQGVVSFADELWAITVPNGTVTEISDISTKRGSPIDVVNGQVSPDERFLLFTDKVSGTLWSLQMKP